jgi:hypothetical protein
MLPSYSFAQEFTPIYLFYIADTMPESLILPMAADSNRYKFPFISTSVPNAYNIRYEYNNASFVSQSKHPTHMVKDTD